MRRTARTGMSLVEVAVALGIITVLLVPSAGMWLAAAKANVETGHLVDAVVLGQLIMESRVRVVPYDNQVPAHAADPDTGLIYDLALVQLTPTLRRADVTVTVPGDPQPLVRLSCLSAKEN